MCRIYRTINNHIPTHIWVYQKGLFSFFKETQKEVETENLEHILVSMKVPKESVKPSSSSTMKREAESRNGSGQCRVRPPRSPFKALPQESPASVFPSRILDLFSPSIPSLNPSHSKPMSNELDKSVSSDSLPPPPFLHSMRRVHHCILLYTQKGRLLCVEWPSLRVAWENRGFLPAEWKGVTQTQTSPCRMDMQMTRTSGSRDQIYKKRTRKEEKEKINKVFPTGAKDCSTRGICRSSSSSSHMTAAVAAAVPLPVLSAGQRSSNFFFHSSPRLLLLSSSFTSSSSSSSSSLTSSSTSSCAPASRSERQVRMLRKEGETWASQSRRRSRTRSKRTWRELDPGHRQEEKTRRRTCRAGRRKEEQEEVVEVERGWGGVQSYSPQRQARWGNFSWHCVMRMRGMETTKGRHPTSIPIHDPGASPPTDKMSEDVAKREEAQRAQPPFDEKNTNVLTDSTPPSVNAVIVMTHGGKMQKKKDKTKTTNKEAKGGKKVVIHKIKKLLPKEETKEEKKKQGRDKSEIDDEAASSITSWRDGRTSADSSISKKRNRSHSTSSSRTRRNTIHTSDSSLVSPLLLLPLEQSYVAHGDAVGRWNTLCNEWKQGEGDDSVFSARGSGTTTTVCTGSSNGTSKGSVRTTPTPTTRRKYSKINCNTSTVSPEQQNIPLTTQNSPRSGRKFLSTTLFPSSLVSTTKSCSSTRYTPTHPANNVDNAINHHHDHDHAVSSSWKFVPPPLHYTREAFAEVNAYDGEFYFIDQNKIDHGRGEREGNEEYLNEIMERKNSSFSTQRMETSLNDQSNDRKPLSSGNAWDTQYKRVHSRSGSSPNLASMDGRLQEGGEGEGEGEGDPLPRAHCCGNGVTDGSTSLRFTLSSLRKKWEEDYKKTLWRSLTFRIRFQIEEVNYTTPESFASMGQKEVKEVQQQQHKEEEEGGGTEKKKWERQREKKCAGRKSLPSQRNQKGNTKGCSISPGNLSLPLPSPLPFPLRHFRKDLPSSLYNRIKRERGGKRPSAALSGPQRDCQAVCGNSSSTPFLSASSSSVNSLVLPSSFAFSSPFSPSSIFRTQSCSIKEVIPQWNYAAVQQREEEEKKREEGDRGTDSSGTGSSWTARSSWKGWGWSMRKRGKANVCLPMASFLDDNGEIVGVPPCHSPPPPPDCLARRSGAARYSLLSPLPVPSPSSSSSSSPLPLSYLPNPSVPFSSPYVVVDDGTTGDEEEGKEKDNEEEIRRHMCKKDKKSTQNGEDSHKGRKTGEGKKGFIMKKREKHRATTQQKRRGRREIKTFRSSSSTSSSCSSSPVVQCTPYGLKISCRRAYFSSSSFLSGPFHFSHEVGSSDIDVNPSDDEEEDDERDHLRRSPFHSGSHASEKSRRRKEEEREESSRGNMSRSSHRGINSSVKNGEVHALGPVGTSEEESGEEDLWEPKRLSRAATTTTTITSNSMLSKTWTRPPSITPFHLHRHQHHHETFFWSLPPPPPASPSPPLFSSVGTSSSPKGVKSLLNHNHFRHSIFSRQRKSPRKYENKKKVLRKDGKELSISDHLSANLDEYLGKRGIKKGAKKQEKEAMGRRKKQGGRRGGDELFPTDLIVQAFCFRVLVGTQQVKKEDENEDKRMNMVEKEEAVGKEDFHTLAIPTGTKKKKNEIRKAPKHQKAVKGSCRLSSSSPSSLSLCLPSKRGPKRNKRQPKEHLEGKVYTEKEREEGLKGEDEGTPTAQSLPLPPLTPLIILDWEIFPLAVSMRNPSHPRFPSFSCEGRLREMCRSSTSTNISTCRSSSDDDNGDDRDNGKCLKDSSALECNSEREEEWTLSSIMSIPAITTSSSSSFTSPNFLPSGNPRCCIMKGVPSRKELHHPYSYPHYDDCKNWQKEEEGDDVHSWLWLISGGDGAGKLPFSTYSRAVKIAAEEGRAKEKCPSLLPPSPMGVWGAVEDCTIPMFSLLFPEIPSSKLCTLPNKMATPDIYPCGKQGWSQKRKKNRRFTEDKMNEAKRDKKKVGTEKISSCSSSSLCFSRTPPLSSPEQHHRHHHHAEFSPRLLNASKSEKEEEEMKAEAENAEDSDKIGKMEWGGKTVMKGKEKEGLLKVSKGHPHSHHYDDDQDDEDHANKEKEVKQDRVQVGHDGTLTTTSPSAAATAADHHRQPSCPRQKQQRPPHGRPSTIISCTNWTTSCSSSPSRSPALPSPTPVAYSCHPSSPSTPMKKLSVSSSPQDRIFAPSLSSPSPPSPPHPMPHSPCVHPPHSHHQQRHSPLRTSSIIVGGMLSDASLNNIAEASSINGITTNYSRQHHLHHRNSSGPSSRSCSVVLSALELSHNHYHTATNTTASTSTTHLPSAPSWSPVCSLTSFAPHVVLPSSPTSSTYLSPFPVRSLSINSASTPLFPLPLAADAPHHYPYRYYYYPGSSPSSSTPPLSHRIIDQNGRGFDRLSSTSWIDTGEGLEAEGSRSNGSPNPIIAPTYVSPPAFPPSPPLIMKSEDEEKSSSTGVSLDEYAFPSSPTAKPMSRGTRSLSRARSSRYSKEKKVENEKQEEEELQRPGSQEMEERRGRGTPFPPSSVASSSSCAYCDDISSEGKTQRTENNEEEKVKEMKHPTSPRHERSATTCRRIKKKKNRNKKSGEWAEEWNAPEGGSLSPPRHWHSKQKRTTTTPATSIRGVAVGGRDVILVAPPPPIPIPLYLSSPFSSINASNSNTPPPHSTFEMHHPGLPCRSWTEKFSGIRGGSGMRSAITAVGGGAAGAAPPPPPPPDPSSSASSSSVVVQVTSYFENNLEPLRLLGRGAQGAVLLCRERTSKQLYAVKILLVDNYESERDVFQEIHVHSSVKRCKYLVQYHSSWSEVITLKRGMELASIGLVPHHLPRGTNEHRHRHGHHSHGRHHTGHHPKGPLLHAGFHSPSPMQSIRKWNGSSHYWTPHLSPVVRSPVLRIIPAAAGGGGDAAAAATAAISALGSSSSSSLSFSLSCHPEGHGPPLLPPPKRRKIRGGEGEEEEEPSKAEEPPKSGRHGVVPNVMANSVPYTSGSFHQRSHLFRPPRMVLPRPTLTDTEVMEAEGGYGALTVRSGSPLWYRPHTTRTERARDYATTRSTNKSTNHNNDLYHHPTNCTHTRRRRRQTITTPAEEPSQIHSQANHDSRAVSYNRTLPPSLLLTSHSPCPSPFSLSRKTFFSTVSPLTARKGTDGTPVESLPTELREFKNENLHNNSCNNKHHDNISIADKKVWSEGEDTNVFPISSFSAPSFRNSSPPSVKVEEIEKNDDTPQVRRGTSRCVPPLLHLGRKKREELQGGGNGKKGRKGRNRGEDGDRITHRLSSPSSSSSSPSLSFSFSSSALSFRTPNHHNDGDPVLPSWSYLLNNGDEEQGLGSNGFLDHVEGMPFSYSISSSSSSSSSSSTSTSTSQTTSSRSALPFSPSTSTNTSFSCLSSSSSVYRHLSHFTQNSTTQERSDKIIEDWEVSYTGERYGTKKRCWGKRRKSYHRHSRPLRDAKDLSQRRGRRRSKKGCSGDNRGTARACHLHPTKTATVETEEQDPHSRSSSSTSTTITVDSPDASTSDSTHDSTLYKVYTRAAHQLLDKRVAFIQMELCHATLSHLLSKRQKIDRIENLVILIQLCSGLLYMHGHGLIHRDVKPTNIFLDFSPRMESQIPTFGSENDEEEEEEEEDSEYEEEEDEMWIGGEDSKHGRERTPARGGRRSELSYSQQYRSKGGSGMEMMMLPLSAVRLPHLVTAISTAAATGVPGSFSSATSPLHSVTTATNLLDGHSAGMRGSGAGSMRFSPSFGTPFSSSPNTLSPSTSFHAPAPLSQSLVPTSGSASRFYPADTREYDRGLMSGGMGSGIFVDHATGSGTAAKRNKKRYHEQSIPAAVRERESINMLLREMRTIPAEDSREFIRRHSQKLIERWRRLGRLEGIELVVTIPNPSVKVEGTEEKEKMEEAEEKEEGQQQQQKKVVPIEQGSPVEERRQCRTATAPVGEAGVGEVPSSLSSSTASAALLSRSSSTTLLRSSSPTCPLFPSVNAASTPSSGVSIKDGRISVRKMSSRMRKLYRKALRLLHRSLLKHFILVRLGDFGLAKLECQQQPQYFQGSSLLSIKNANTLGVGSPLYASPEQLRGDVCTCASDVFSLGIVMVEMYVLPTTMAERLDVLQKAREGKYPTQDVLKQYPELSVIPSLTQEHTYSRKALPQLKRFLVKYLRQCLQSEFVNLAGEISGSVAC